MNCLESFQLLLNVVYVGTDERFVHCGDISFFTVVNESHSTIMFAQPISNANSIAFWHAIVSVAKWGENITMEF